MIDRYLESGSMYLLREDGVPACVTVLADLGGGSCELKNLATEEALQNRGYAGRMLRFLMETCARTYQRMYVGTSGQMVPYYERFGFSYSHTEREFFTRNYPEPIWENGFQCVDMLYLKRDL
ncbi:GNAT family N-acetyltransferase [Blautia wexlerae]|nr:GNAT family N-acetyltransferase [Blautia wexlerae]